MGSFHGDIQPQTVHITEEGQIKLMHNLSISGGKSGYTKMITNDRYRAALSPIQLKQKAAMKLKTDDDKIASDVWGIGMTALCACTNKSVDFFYDWELSRVRYDLIKQYFDQMYHRHYSDHLISIISEMLEETEARRAKLDDLIVVVRRVREERDFSSQITPQTDVSLILKQLRLSKDSQDSSNRNRSTGINEDSKYRNSRSIGVSNQRSNYPVTTEKPEFELEEYDALPLEQPKANIEKFKNRCSKLELKKKQFECLKVPALKEKGERFESHPPNEFSYSNNRKKSITRAPLSELDLKQNENQIRKNGQFPKRPLLKPSPGKRNIFVDPLLVNISHRSRPVYEDQRTESITNENAIENFMNNSMSRSESQEELTFSKPSQQLEKEKNLLSMNMPSKSPGPYPRHIIYPKNSTSIQIFPKRGDVSWSTHNRSIQMTSDEDGFNTLREDRRNPRNRGYAINRGWR